MIEGFGQTAVVDRCESHRRLSAMHYSDGDYTRRRHHDQGVLEWARRPLRARDAEMQGRHFHTHISDPTGKNAQISSTHAQLGLKHRADASPGFARSALEGVGAVRGGIHGFSGEVADGTFLASRSGRGPRSCRPGHACIGVSVPRTRRQALRARPGSPGVCVVVRSRLRALRGTVSWC